jgi:hypothetical protein
MTQRTMRRAAALAALAAALSLPLPARAAGFRHGPPVPSFAERAWHWLTAWIVPDGNSRTHPTSTNIFGNDGIMIDPNGNHGAAACPPTQCLEPQAQFGT